MEDRSNLVIIKSEIQEETPEERSTATDRFGPYKEHNYNEVMSEEFEKNKKLMRTEKSGCTKQDIDCTKFLTKEQKIKEEIFDYEVTDLHHSIDIKEEDEFMESERTGIGEVESDAQEEEEEYSVAQDFRMGTMLGQPIKFKRKQFTVGQKKDILQKVHAGVRKSDVCKEFSLSSSTLSTFLKNENKLNESSIENTKRKKQRTTKRKDLDEALLNWFRIQRNKSIRGPTLKKKATQFGVLLGYGDDFKCSTSWINRFKRRHNINFGKVVGETKSVRHIVTGDWLSDYWLRVKCGYADVDIFNADETGLFYKLTPDKTLKYKDEKCCGGKLSNERVTVFLCANADGSEKRKLLIVGQVKMPRCFRDIKSLPVKYRANKTAWMTSEYFAEELRDWDSELIQKNRKILLVVKHCPAHREVSDLKNINLVFLPHNTMTSVLQPMDHGIINSLKFNYRKILVLHVIDSIENKKKNLVTLLDAIRFVDRAWMNVAQVTIRNCFNRSGFLNKVTADEEDCQWDDAGSLSELLNTKIVSFEEFVQVDNLVSTSEENVNEECGIESAESDEDETSPLPEKISRLEARNCLMKVRSFFENGNVAEESFNFLSSLENLIDLTALKEKQRKITDYFV